MKKKSNLQVLLCVAALVSCADAETLVMGQAGSGEKQSFYKATDWYRENGTFYTNDVPVAGNDYVVAQGYEMSVNATKEFGGNSLQFGYVGGSTGSFWHTVGGTTVTVPRLILANGRYRVWQNKESVAKSYLKGNVEVLSPAETPFLISPTHVGSATSYEIQWDAKLTGLAGTGILVASLSSAIGDGTPRLVFNGDNSGYFGKIAVKHPNLTFCVTKASALGGALAEFDEEALTLDEQCIFECSATAEILSSSANRGIKVKSGGAKISIPSGKSLRIEWPIALDGVLEKIGGGNLVLASEITGNGVFVASDGVIVTVPPGRTNGVSNIEFSGGTFVVSHDVESGASGVLELNDWPVGKIRVRPPAERKIKVPFLRVPVSAEEVKPSDFVAAEGDIVELGLPSVKVSVEIEGDWQIAYAETADKIEMSSSVNAAYALQEPSGWSDNRLMHCFGDYVVDAKKAGKSLSFSVGALSSIDKEDLNYAMPANTTLTFTGDGDNNKIATWNIRQETFSGNVRAVGRRIEFLACGNTEPALNSPYEESVGDVHVLKGRIHVDNSVTDDSGLKFWCGCSRTVKIESEISGKGTVCLRPKGNEDEKKICTYIISGTNSFTGKWFLYNSYDVASTNIFRFSDEKNLGPGNDTDLLLQTKSGNSAPQTVIHPIGSVKVNLPQRPLFFYAGNLNVKVDAGHELKWDSSVKFRSGTTSSLTVLRKLGGGIWAIGGTVTLNKADNVEDKWTFNVDEGYVRADNARAFSGMTVTFAEGAGIAAKYDPAATGESAKYGMIVTDAAKFNVNGSKLKVKVDTDGDLFSGKSLPVLTVPVGAADRIGAKLKGECDIPMGSVAFVRENVNLNNGEFVRFSAEIHRGTVIVVR